MVKILRLYYTLCCAPSKQVSLWSIFKRAKPAEKIYICIYPHIYTHTYIYVYIYIYIYTQARTHYIFTKKKYEPLVRTAGEVECLPLNLNFSEKAGKSSAAATAAAVAVDVASATTAAATSTHKRARAKYRLSYNIRLRHFSPIHFVWLYDSSVLQGILVPSMLRTRYAHAIRSVYIYIYIYMKVNVLFRVRALVCRGRALSSAVRLRGRKR